jgi:hypothetical protein
MSLLHDRIYIEKGEIEEVYDNIQLIEGEQRKDQFILAMAIGFELHDRIPLKAKQTLFLTKYLKPEDEALINALALYESDDVEILADKGEVFKIAEEYANAGIQFLKQDEEQAQMTSFNKIFEKKIVDLYNEIELDIKGG